jgi:hypothetical protein
MKKQLLYVLIACFAIMTQGVAQAAVPITPSTDTGVGAKWYRLKNARAVSQGKAAYMKADNYDVTVVMADFVESDNFLWCFVPDATNGGYQIYNKALLAEGARLISIEGGNGSIKIEKSTTSWAYSWALKDDSGSYGLLPGTNSSPGSATNNNYLHGTLDVAIIFYGHVATEGGSAWIFEDAAVTIIVDLSQLTSLITTCSTQVNTDKTNSQKATKYAVAISAYEAAIATAQAVANNSASSQANVNSATVELKKAKNDYHLGCVDLPFTVSQGTNMVWYRILNVRRDDSGVGYLTYNNDVLSTTALTTSDNQLWAFAGNNVTGISVYNKGNQTEGAKLIYSDNSFKISVSSWDGIWKVDSRIDGGFNYYGICNTKGVYDSNFVPNDFIHGTLDGGIVFYGFSDLGSLLRFAPETPAAIETTDASSDIHVFSHNGVISVNGAEGMASIVSMTGATVTFDTQKAYNVGGKGIYIVRVNGRVYKVIVK